MDWTPDRIRDFRKYLEMSQIKFAEMLGVRQATVSDWETGARTPLVMGQRLLDCLAEKHGFTLDKQR